MQVAAAKQQRSWKINIDAKFNKFHFKFKATKADRTWKFLKFSIFLRLHQFFLEVKTDYNQTTNLTSKFLNCFRNFKILKTKKRPIVAEKASILQYPESKILADPQRNFTNEERIGVGSLFIGNLALLSKSIYEKDEKGMAIHGLLSILLFLALLIQKCVAKKARTVMLSLTIILLVNAVVLAFDKNIYYGTKDYLMQLVWKTCNFVAFLR